MHRSASVIPIITGIVQAIVALGGLLLAGYVLIYQKDKDKRIEFQTAQIDEQQIKLQWFKELIVQPNKKKISHFYSNMHTLKEKIKANDLTSEEKEDINEFVKSELVILRKSFVDLLLHTDKTLYDNILGNLDHLTDEITLAIFDDTLKLKNSAVYEKHIGSKISYSNNELISQLYHYNGRSV